MRTSPHTIRLIDVRAVVAALVATLALASALAAALPAAAPAAAGYNIGIEAENQIYADSGTREQAFATMQQLGVHVTRSWMFWDQIGAGCGGTNPATLANPDSPCYSWATIDDIVARAAAHHVSLMVSVVGVPRWSNDHPNQFNLGASSAKFNQVSADYARFVTAAATRYNGRNGHGFIPFWTIWNEPNSRTFFAPYSADSPRRYAQLYAASAKALKKANPKALVAPGPTGPNSTGAKPITYLQQLQPWLAKYGAGPYINAWAHNPYPAKGRSPHAIAYKSPSVGIGNFGDLLRQLDANKVTRHKPVWATEFSYETRPADRHGVSLGDQATFLAQCFDILWSSHRVSIALWYVMKDPVGEPDWQSGLVSSKGAAKPAFAMYQRMVSLAATSVRRGGHLRLWGKSNVSGGTTTLVWSANRRGWKKIPGSHGGAGGVAIANPVFKRSMFVAVRDNKGVGPARLVTAR